MQLCSEDIAATKRDVKSFSGQFLTELGAANICHCCHFAVFGVAHLGKWYHFRWYILPTQYATTTRNFVEATSEQFPKFKGDLDPTPFQGQNEGLVGGTECPLCKALWPLTLYTSKMTDFRRSSLSCVLNAVELLVKLWCTFPVFARTMWDKVNIKQLEKE